MTSSKPAWLARPIAHGGASRRVCAALDSTGLRTVCAEARCPNRGECFAAGTATFLILGGRCTRSCRFCAISHDIPAPPDPGEPGRVADAVHDLGLSHAVVTSVTRDDLPDGGASQFAAVIRAIRGRMPGTTVEVLIPDFGGEADALGQVLSAAPAVLAHNVETVPRLYGAVRPGARYERSLELIKRIGGNGCDIRLKSGLMLGLGETAEEILAVLADLRRVGCGILTLGQYLRPDRRCVPVARFITPDEFTRYRAAALGMGFAFVEAGPYVRSSYHAERALAGNHLDRP